MIAALGMGKGVLPPPDTFALVPMVVAMAIHFMLAIVLAVVLALFVNRVELGMAALSYKWLQNRKGREAKF